MAISFTYEILMRQVLCRHCPFIIPYDPSSGEMLRLVVFRPVLVYPASTLQDSGHRALSSSHLLLEEACIAVSFQILLRFFVSVFVKTEGICKFDD